MKKSYHSIVVPTVAAITALRRCALCSASESWSVVAPRLVPPAQAALGSPDCRYPLIRAIAWLNAVCSMSLSLEYASSNAPAAFHCCAWS